MAILTRETNGTGVTNNGAPLTNAELDNNFIELVADIADKVSTADLSESVDDRVNGLLQAGLGIDLDYDDVAGELTIDSNHVEVNCTNNSGSSIAIGTPVYQTGVSGNNITIAPADADDAAKMPAIGLTTSTIADAGEGTIVILGVVNGLDTSSFTAGDTVYVSTTAGALTTTAPSGESGLIQNFGRVLKVNVSSGSIAVMGAGRANAVPNLNDGNVFIGNASNQAETRALVEADISDFGTYLTAESDTLDSVTGRGATTSNNIQVGDATVTGDLTVQGTTTTLNTATLDVEDKNITINYSAGDSSGSADGAGITIQDAVNSTTDATILWDATGDKFEFSHAVDVAGNITLTGTVDGRDIATDGTKLDGIEASADVTDATNVAAAGAVMDGDFTSNGFMKRTGAGTYTVDTSTYLTSFTETNDLTSAVTWANVPDANITESSVTQHQAALSITESQISDLQSYLTSVSVDGLSDATITTPADNEVLAYDSTSSEWINQTAAEAGLATSAQGTLADSALQPADLSVTTNAAGTAALTYTSGTGVFSYTPPDLSSYLTSYTETDTLDSVTGRGATTTNAVTVGNLTSTGIDDNASSTAITIASTGRVGIGDTTPDSGLTVHDNSGAVIATSNIARQTYTSIGNLQVSTAGSGGILIHSESTTAEGAVTFGDGAYAGRILYNHTDNYMGFHTNAGERMRLEADGDLHADGDVIAYSTTISDERLKDDVETIDSALHKVSALRGVTYTWNAGSREGKRDLGVIAQEVEAVIPEIVHEKNMALIDGETYKTVDYEKLTAVLIEAVKQLKAEVEALKDSK
jgi:hypothetical protein